MTTSDSTDNNPEGPKKNNESERPRAADEVAAHIADVLRGQVEGVKLVDADDPLFPTAVRGIPALEVMAKNLGVDTSGIALMDLGGYVEHFEGEIPVHVAFNAGFLAAQQALGQGVGSSSN